MDNTYSKRKHGATPLSLPILINKDGSASTSLKVSISAKQLDENTKITVNLKPADVFTSMAKYEIGIGVNDRKKKTKKFNGGAHFVVVEIIFFAISTIFIKINAIFQLVFVHK